MEGSPRRSEAQSVEGHISLGSDEDSSSENTSSSDTAENHTMSGGMRCDLTSPRSPRQSFPADTPLTPRITGPLKLRSDIEAFDDQACLADTDEEEQEEVPHWQFCNELQGGLLPRDDENREGFDEGQHFVLGDPSTHTGKDSEHAYEITGEAGFPIWEDLFYYILHSCGYLVNFDTVYVLVDTRPLHLHDRRDPTLPHWPAAASWWESRLQMRGPRNERTELLFLQAGKDTGLHNVHPTWAGTFVLAALGAVFPGVHLMLLDSDCLPVTGYKSNFSLLLVKMDALPCYIIGMIW